MVLSGVAGLDFHPPDVILQVICLRAQPQAVPAALADPIANPFTINGTGAMHRRTILALLVVLASQVLSAPASAGGNTWMSVEILVPRAGDLTSLIAAGIDPEGALGKPGGPMRFVVDERTLGKLSASGVRVRVVDGDLVASYASRLKGPADALGRGVGSMGGYYTLEEVITQLDSLHLLFPNVIGVRESIGVSLQGRAIWAVRVTGDPATAPARPRVFFTGLTHAREPMGMMTILHLLWYVGERYDVDPEVTHLLGTRELWVVPVVNPDGYEANRRSAPNGGGMRRKNMRNAVTDDDNRGVDLNRNYGFQWGYDDFGSTPYPEDLAYRGSAPFSEPETQAIRNFCIDRQFLLALNYHSYSNVLIYPWGYLDEETEDSLIYREYASAMTRHNGYAYGTGDQVIGYPTNGDADDWMYGERSVKPKVLSMTPEVGTGSDGFWPEPDRILPLAEANVRPNLIMLWAAGGYPRLRSAEVVDSSGDGFLERGEPFTIHATVANAGLSGLDDLSVSVAAGSPAVELDRKDTTLTDILSRTTRECTFTGRAGWTAVDGAEEDVIVSFGVGGTPVLFDSIHITFGKAQVVFQDGAELDLGAWRPSGSWGRSSASHSGDWSLSDSPIGAYQNSASSELRLSSPVRIPAGATAAELVFWTRWEIETLYDFGQVQASTNGGTTWRPLAGRYTKAGSGRGVQAPGEPGYDGRQIEWLEERMDLSGFTGDSLLIRFVLSSDEYLTMDGWYVDDIQVRVFGDGVSSAGDPARHPRAFGLAQNFPNPFNPETIIEYTVGEWESSGEGRVVELVVYDLLGRKLLTLVNEAKRPGKYRVRVDGRGLSSGTYFYRMRAGEFVETRTLTVIR
jgi:carboxypeptidase T